jgi:hypothetical protein
LSITTISSAISYMYGPQTFFKVPTPTPVVGTMYSLWTAAGMPGAGTIPPTGLLAGQFFTCAAAQITGQIYFQNPAAGDTTYLARFAGTCNTYGTLILADRIWGDSVSPVRIGAQVINSGAFPRSAGIGGGDSSGTGVQLAIEVYTTLGAAAATPKVSYVPVGGSMGSTGGDTGAAAYAVPATAAAGTFIPINLKAGAFGVKAVTAYNNMTTKTSGVLGLVAYRPLAYIPCSAPEIYGVADCLTGGFPIMFPNTVPMLIWMAGTATVPVISGQFQFTQN